MARKKIKLPTYRQLKSNPLWNIFLLTVGAAFTSFGSQAISAHIGSLTGGMLGLGLLIWYSTGWLSAPILTFILNIPLLIFSWFKVSRRFVMYSLYGTFAVFVFGMLMDNVQIELGETLYGAVLAGVMMGIGGGIMLRSLGSGGGLDLVAVYINEKFNIPIGRFSLFFNTALFIFSLPIIGLDMVMLSFIQVFITSSVMDAVINMFNQRKIVMIITAKGQEICNEIVRDSGRATILPAYGGYSHEAREVVMTVTTNFTLRYLEDMVFAIDPEALFTVQNSYYVTGAQYPRESK